jgi:hemolysin-activating ACP:hemolysin acyltransferase
MAAALGDIMSELLRSPQHRHAFISDLDLEWLVLPALATGQLALAQGRSQGSGASAALAVLLWASVSDEVDARLSTNRDGPVRLRPAEWQSGSHV